MRSFKGDADMDKKTVFRTTCFFIVVIVVLSWLSIDLRVHGISDNSETGFFKQEDDTIDIIYAGSCHAYSSVIPSVVEAKTGLRGYVLAGDNLDAKMMYYYLDSALKRQSPQIVVLEVFSFAIYESYTSKEEISTSIRKNVVDLPFKEKISFIRDEEESGTDNWIYYLFDIGFFHDNWTETDTFNMTRASDDNGWLSFGDKRLAPENAVLRQDKSSIEKYMQPETKEWFYRIIDLLEANNIEVIFYAAPYIITDYELPVYNWIEEYSKESGIPFFNLTDNDTLEKLAFTKKYMNESRHVNKEGAEYVSACLGDFINEL